MKLKAAPDDTETKLKALLAAIVFLGNFEFFQFRFRFQRLANNLLKVRRSSCL